MNLSTRTDGDRLAGVLRSHWAELVRLAAFVLGDKSAGEDIVQDVFVRLHRRPEMLAEDPLPYLRRAVINGSGRWVIAWPPQPAANAPVWTDTAGWISGGQLHPLPVANPQTGNGRIYGGSVYW
jgi:hypothetical protein